MMLQLKIEDIVYIHLNQAWREGEVLAVIKNKALIEYEMPSDVTYMIIVQNPCGEFDKKQLGMEGRQFRKIRGWRLLKAIIDGAYDSISYNALNKKWLKELVRTGKTWYGGHIFEKEWRTYYGIGTPLLTPQERLDGKQPVAKQRL